jgi:hypothetical protein
MSKYLYQAVARQIADKIAALDKMDNIDTFAPIILEIVRGVDYRVWHVLDEQPGLFNYMNDRFYMLRQVRNNPTYGRVLFDNLTG